MGHVIATTINLSALSIVLAYVGSEPIGLAANMGRDFMDGFSGRPVEMNYRPGWHNFGLGCGSGGECDD